MNYYISNDELYHHGILGMKWGVWNDETRARRTGRKTRIKRNSWDRNADAMAEGAKHARSAADEARQSPSERSSATTIGGKKTSVKRTAEEWEAAAKEFDQQEKWSRERADKKRQQTAIRNEKIKNVAKTGAAVVGSLLAAYGVMKIGSMLSNSGSLPVKYPSSSDIKRRVNQNLMDDYMTDFKRTLDNATRASRMRNNINSARNRYIFTGNDKAWKNIMSDMSNMSMDDLRKLDLY